jgi:hypothetical protein
LDKSAELLQLLKNQCTEPDTVTGLKIVRVTTTEPHPYKFIFEGTKPTLDIDLFEVPVCLYPLCLNDRFLAYPLIEQDNSQRWGLLTKINNYVNFATMTGANTCRVPGIGRDYGPDDLIIPPYFSMHNELSTDGHCGHSYLKIDDIRPLKSGDVVSLLPTAAGGKIKYVVTYFYSDEGAS